MSENQLAKSLSKYNGYKMGIYLNDGQYVEGTLFGVDGDLLTLKDEYDDFVYFNLKLVKAVSRNTRDYKPIEKEGFNEESSLLNVIKNHKYHWVKVKCHNDLSFSGVLSEANEKFIILTIKDKQVFIQTEHIHDFFPGLPSNYSSDSKEEKSQNSQSDNQKNNSSKNKVNKKKIYTLMQYIGGQSTT